VIGFILLGAAWKVLYQAQRTGQVAMTGPYAHVRHPQYIGFILIMLGFLIEWPTFLTLIMFPILVIMYIFLARREEQESLSMFGDDYASYVAQTPAFFPKLPHMNSGQP
jgi:protein-S-isoprenylcysteine O-methyltransferase Ste14